MRPDQDEPISDAKPVRVLLAEDSPFMQRMITNGIEKHGRAKVVAVTGSCRQAIELAGIHQPDVIILDLRLEDGHGIEVLDSVTHLKSRVLVVSAFTTENESETALEALAKGALACLGKPGLDVTPGEFLQSVEESVIEIAALDTPSTRPLAGTPDYKIGENAPEPKSSSIVGAPDKHLIIIGASTGGPRAITELLTKLPVGFRSPILVLQHLPESMGGVFARRLEDVCAVPVAAVRNDMRIKPGRVHVVPAGHHICINGDLMTFTEDNHIPGNTPSIDMALQYAADSWRGSLTSIILTGIGKDGARGSEQVRKAGGNVIVQDADTSTVFGMPRAVVERVPDATIMPLYDIADWLVESGVSDE